ncbi:hypothetical protein [Neolewinella antarctica]|uniref:Uncharacterized protein n=1 Tax=Neolewinella antarctica TaxID=442734 RepID=A0ABX0X642_9BACT|nr:hypothetical protein [Neolewinella antarctica]NJC24670.1 hypothetical protein [Neolewinella antarctica]
MPVIIRELILTIRSTEVPAEPHVREGSATDDWLRETDESDLLHRAVREAVEEQSRIEQRKKER